MFIRQSFRSNYCGVYATGMLLSLLGETTTRRRVLDLFGLKRSNADYHGTTHADIAGIFACRANAKWSCWDFYDRFDFALVAKCLNRQLEASGSPTLLSFGAIHKNQEWQCMHVAVVLRATQKVIEMLDPLGNKLDICTNVNVWLLAPDSGRSIEVIGASYSINDRSQTAILRWALKESHD
jgi:hypothetical protein